MELFTRDWKIDPPIPEYLCSSSLHQLSVADLHRLYEFLQKGWTQEIVVRKGDGTSKSSCVWVTPTHRS